MYLLCGSLCVTVLIYDVNIENRSLMNINFLIKIPFGSKIKQKEDKSAIGVSAKQSCLFSTSFFNNFINKKIKTYNCSKLKKNQTLPK